jgi:UDP-glucose:(heptosyl)LPS alpha-1,3-glucosyltransferase
VEEAYAGADLFVLPTHYDPFGSSCLEALACGLPVVTTRFAGAAEVIEEGRVGKVVPYPEPAFITDAIETIHKQRNWGEVNAEAWRIAQCLSLDRNTDAILSLFAQLKGTS